MTIISGPPGSALVVRDVPAGGMPWVGAMDVAHGMPVTAADVGSGGRHPVASMAVHVTGDSDYVESTD